MIRRLLIAAAVAAVAAVLWTAPVAAHGDEDDAVNGCYNGGYQTNEPNCGDDGEPGSAGTSAPQPTSGCEWVYPPGGGLPVWTCDPDSSGEAPPLISIRITW